MFCANLIRELSDCPIASDEVAELPRAVQGRGVPVDMIVDMGFVRKLGVDKKNNNILLSLVELAHRLNMKVVAEGVETEEQAEFLQGYGCDYLQGFYFSRPMPEAQFEQLLEQ